MAEYVVIFERAKDGGWGAYVPDLPGLGVVGETLDEAKALIRDGIPLHIDGLREDGLPLPVPQTVVERFSVPA